MQSSRLAALLIAGTLGCARPTPEMQIVAGAADAMGGRDRILGVNTLTLGGDGRNFNLGQNRSPDADLPLLAVQSYFRSIDFANARWRQEQLRIPQYPTGNPSAQQQVTALDGDMAFNVAPSGEATRVADAVARDRRVELLHHPVGFLRAALQEGATLANARTEGGHDLVDLATADGTVTLSIDSATRLPATIVSQTDNVNLGDVAVETAFANYRDIAGLKLPGRMTTKVDRYTVAEIDLVGQTVNAELGDLAAPESVRAAPPPDPVVNVAVEQVAPGIWYLAGGSHHSVVVEFADHLTLIEAPQNDARTLAVIAKARELSAKPLTEVVVSHHHFDHSGGVRAAVSEGLTVVAHESTRAFFEDVVARPHTLRADALARGSKPMQIQTVGAEHTLSDASRTVILYHIDGSLHADTLLMAYFPRERLLVQADVFSPPAPNAATPPAFPFVPNLMENLQNRKLRVDRILPLHGRIVPYSDLVAAAQSMAETTTSQ